MAKAPKMGRMKFNVEFSPTLIMTMNKERLGSMTFESPEVMGRFMGRLRKAIELLIEEFKDEEKRTENRGVRCRS